MSIAPKNSIFRKAIIIDGCSTCVQMEPSNISAYRFHPALKNSLIKGNDMQKAKNRITISELIHTIIPKLKATEKLIGDTLLVLLETAGDEDEHNRRALQRQEFELEVTMIRMNLDHLMKRYAREIQEVVDATDDRPGALLRLDQHERLAIENARRLYERGQATQTA